MKKTLKEIWVIIILRIFIVTMSGSMIFLFSILLGLVGINREHFFLPYPYQAESYLVLFYIGYKLLIDIRGWKLWFNKEIQELPMKILIIKDLGLLGKILLAFGESAAHSQTK